MNRYQISAALLGLAVLAGSIVIAEEARKPAAPAMQLPPGWTADDMQTCALAATPGKNHALLTKAVGTWTGKSTMWMFPDTPPMESACSATYTSAMDGRFVKIDWSGDMPGMGPYSGFGQQGFDNSLGKFTGTWIDNMGTGMMLGTGELSPDGKSITWTYTMTCPLNKKPAVMRQVETWTSDTTKTLDMWGPEPKSGKEYKVMHVELTKK